MQKIKRAAVKFLAIASLLFASTSSHASYPGWNNDVDYRNGNPWIGYGGTLHYVVYDFISDRHWILRWPPPPGETDPSYDQLMAVFNEYAGIDVLNVHDGAIYAAGTGITSVGNDFGSASVHGIAKVDLITLQPSDPVSTSPPMPNVYGIVWDHNGTMYVAGSTTTTGDHYDTNMFMKWNGSAWVTIGGGIHVNSPDQSFVRCMATDGTNIFLGGKFIGFKQSGGTTGSAANIMSYNVDTGLFYPMTTGLIGGSDEGPAIVQTMAIGGTNLFVTGTFTNHYSSDKSDGGIARFSSVNLAVQPFGTVARNSVTGVASLNNDAYIVGTFDHITNGATVNAITGVARWSPSTATWSALGSGINGDASSVTTDANSVFVSGGFTTAGGLTCSQSARWQVAADSSLQFTSGSVSGTSASLNLSGVPNLDCDVERLSFSSDSWVKQGSLKLDASGAGTFSSSLLNGVGYFRARSRDGSDRYLSTNAFGSIVGSVPSGYWLVGTPFSGMTVSNMFPTPNPGTTAYCYTNGVFVTESWNDLDNNWGTDRGLSQGEGLLVFSAASGTNTIPYRAWGIFSPSSFSRSLPTGYSILCSPLFHKYSGGSATQIDEFNSTRLGGYSLVPVNSSSNPKAYAGRNKTGASNDYINYTLTSGGQWQTNSVNTTVPILMGEGVWVDNLFGSSQTWSVSLPIW